MFKVSWVNSAGEVEDYQAQTEAEREAKLQELQAAGIPCDWEEIK